MKMTPTTTPTEEMTTANVSLPAWLKEAGERWALPYALSFSAVVRLALAEYLGRHPVCDADVIRESNREE